MSTQNSQHITLEPITRQGDLEGLDADIYTRLGYGAPKPDKQVSPYAFQVEWRVGPNQPNAVGYVIVDGNDRGKEKLLFVEKDRGALNPIPLRSTPDGAPADEASPIAKRIESLAREEFDKAQANSTTPLNGYQQLITKYNEVRYKNKPSAMRFFDTIGNAVHTTLDAVPPLPFNQLQEGEMIVSIAKGSKAKEHNIPHHAFVQTVENGHHHIYGWRKAAPGSGKDIVFEEITDPKNYEAAYAERVKRFLSNGRNVDKLYPPGQIAPTPTTKYGSQFEGWEAHPGGVAQAEGKITNDELRAMQAFKGSALFQGVAGEKVKNDPEAYIRRNTLTREQVGQLRVERGVAYVTNQVGPIGREAVIGGVLWFGGNATGKWIESALKNVPILKNFASELGALTSFAMKAAAVVQVGSKALDVAGQFLGGTSIKKALLELVGSVKIEDERLGLGLSK